ncbi:MAG: hypothetical protein KDB00_24475 [Planctomycetales bacterium]|nr:hypothetical protein [Planctomycetales bacterium]
MTTLLNRVFKQREEHERNMHEVDKPLREELLELAIKDAFGDEVTDDDAGNLSALLSDQKMSDDDYVEFVKAIRRIPTAVALIEYLGELHEQKAKEFAEAQRQMHYARMKLENAQRRVNRLAHLPHDNEPKRTLAQLRENAPLAFDESGEPVTQLRTLIDQEKINQRNNDEAKETKANAATFEKMNQILHRLGLEQFPTPGDTE